MAEIPNEDVEQPEATDENMEATPVEVDNRMAVASFAFGILSILSLVVCGSGVAYSQIAMSMPVGAESLAPVLLLCALVLFPLPAIILSLVSLYQINKSPVPMKGRRLGEAGLNMACVSIGLTLFAGILTPSLVRSPIQSNESAAIGNLRKITYVQEDYRKAHVTYARSFAELTRDANSRSFLEGDWYEGVQKTGYVLSLTDSSGNGSCYETKANPVTPDRTGIRYFFSDCSGVIRWHSDGPADSTSTPIGEL